MQILSPIDVDLADNLSFFLKDELLPAGERAYFGGKREIEVLNGSLIQLSSLLSKSSGKFACGDSFSVSDVLLLPFVHRLVEISQAWKGGDLERVKEWYDLVSSRPAFKSTIVSSYWWWW